MSTFPIKVTRISAIHVGGTKEYNTVYIQTADDRVMLIKRWGRVKTFGQVKIETFHDVYAGRRAYDGIFSAKFGNEYTRDRRDKSVECKDETELKRELGPQYCASLGANNLTWLVPGADTAGVREPDTDEWVKGEDGRMTRVTHPKLIPIEEEPVAPLSNDPVWGSW